MHPEFWLERWQQNQIGFHQARVNPYLQQFWPQLGIAQTGRVFVPLCGKSSDMLWLRAQGHEVVGVEFSELAVRDVVHGRPVSNTEALANPASLRQFENLEELRA